MAQSPRVWVWLLSGMVSRSTSAFVDHFATRSTRDSVLSHILHFSYRSLYIASSSTHNACFPNILTLPELDVFLIPIAPRLFTLLFQPSRLLHLLVLFSRSPSGLLLGLDCRPLLLHEFLCLPDTSLLFASVVLADLIRHHRDTTPRSNGPIRGYAYRFCPSISALIHTCTPPPTENTYSL